MNKEDIIRIASEAGFTCDCWLQKTPLESFAKLVAAAEREECARLCENIKSNWNYCAAAIRSRK